MRIGRFEIRGELGRGSQSQVYLAWDPQLQREVAIKTVQQTRHDAAEDAALLAEARMVAGLRHANIVPIHDVGEAGGNPFLVFEYVHAKSLQAHLAERGALPALEAVQLACGILRALEAAHARGIIHRDLKPSNILIDDQGAPRVMDFGIALRIEDAPRGATQDVIAGTPAYLAPEYIDKRTISVQMDVYACGLVLLEMLTGRQAYKASTLEAMFAQKLQKGVTIPPEISISDVLANVVLKACAIDPKVRYESARQMLAALEDYLDADNKTDDIPADVKQSTLDFLLRRMRHKSDFPALSDTVVALNKLTDSNNESVQNLSNAILKDFGLTNKILRIVNTAYFRQVGGGNISTVSRAVTVLGFDAVRNIGVTVLLFEHMQDKGEARELREAFLRANLAGYLARETCRRLGRREGEEAFICGMFHGLGRMLAQYYFPEEVDQIQRLMQQKNIDAERASTAVLGISFQALGIGVARIWGFPPSIVGSLRTLEPGPIKKPKTHDEHMRVIAGFAHETCDYIATAEPAERERAMRTLTERFRQSLELTSGQIKDVLIAANDELANVMPIFHINLKQSPFAGQVRAWTGQDKQDAAAAAPEAAALPDMLEGNILGGQTLTELNLDDRAAILAAGIQDISNSLVEEVPLNDILRIIMETMYRGIGFKHVILCLRDPRSSALTGRFGLGPDVNELVKHIRIPLSPVADVFYAAISKGVDVSISDVSDERIADKIPAWFKRNFQARSFVLFPMVMKGKSIALIYCDKDQANSINLNEKELGLLKTLRNQALLAIKNAT